MVIKDIFNLAIFMAYNILFLISVRLTYWALLLTRTGTKTNIKTETRIRTKNKNKNKTRTKAKNNPSRRLKSKSITNYFPLVTQLPDNNVMMEDMWMGGEKEDEQLDNTLMMLENR